MLTWTRCAASNIPERDDYLKSIVAPSDGMWESAVISNAALWEIREQHERLGYFYLDADNVLLRFHLSERDRPRAGQIFRSLVDAHGIKRAVAGTLEPLYFSLCLDSQRGIEPHSVLFQDSSTAPEPVRATEHTFRKLEDRELAIVTRFYRESAGGPGDWIAPFVRERVQRGELFGLFDPQRLVATGECIPSSSQPPYADLGMIVARPYRGRGLATAMLLHLKTRCYEAGWKPICSCDANNLASRRVIEKSGFVSEHRRVTFTLAPEPSNK